MKADGLISRLSIGIKESRWPAFMGLCNVWMTNVTSHDFLIVSSDAIITCGELPWSRVQYNFVFCFALQLVDGNRVGETHWKLGPFALHVVLSPAPDKS